MRYLTFFVVVALWAQSPRTTPPTLQSVSPRGVARGTIATIEIEGFNLAGTSAIYFSDPQVKGKIVRVKELPDLPDIRIGANGTQSSIDVGPLPRRNQVTVAVELDGEAAIGDVGFRLLTPLGTSPEGRLLIEPFVGEAADAEPNDTLAAASEVFLPAVLVGTIQTPGDVDLYKFTVKAGQKLTVENSSERFGSTLQPVLAILDGQAKVLASRGQEGGSLHFSYQFPQAGTFYLRVTDYERSGRETHQYRIKLGDFHLVSEVFPLGFQQKSSAKIELKGYSVPGALEVKASPADADSGFTILRPAGAYNQVKLALGEDPEVIVTHPSSPVTLPVTLNGKLTAEQPQHRFRFSAKKGQTVVLETMARRLGSPLDTTLEVLTAEGKRIETATVRPVVETFTTLRDHDSVQPGVRITHWNNIFAGDYMMLGREIVRVVELPRGPDADILYEQLEGQRVNFFGTTSEAHAIDKAIYKVQVHPPGTSFAPNGLPVTRLYAQNDDGGPGFGKDSYLRFTAPADSEYQVVVADVTGATGSYRLHLREPRPDFRLALNIRNPNVPRGGTVPLTVTATRLDGFNGPIELGFSQLPKGYSVSKGRIEANQNSGVLLLSATTDVVANEALPFRVTGTALGKTRQANPEDSLQLVAVGTHPDVVMTSATRSVELAPGETAAIQVKISRHNGFAGRVPVEVVNLPPRTKLPDFGLNGVLLNEGETERTFFLEATPAAVPGDYTIAVAGRVETRSTQLNLSAAPETIAVRIKAK